MPVHIPFLLDGLISSSWSLTLSFLYMSRNSLVTNQGLSVPIQQAPGEMVTRDKEGEIGEAYGSSDNRFLFIICRATKQHISICQI